MTTYTITFTTKTQRTEALLALRAHAETMLTIARQYRAEGNEADAKRYQTFVIAANNAAEAIENATVCEVVQ